MDGPDDAAFAQYVRWWLLNSHRWRLVMLFLTFRCAGPLLSLFHQLVACNLATWFIDVLALAVTHFTGHNTTGANCTGTVCKEPCSYDFVFSVTSLLLVLLCYCCAWTYQLAQRCVEVEKAADEENETLQTVVQ